MNKDDFASLQRGLAQVDEYKAGKRSGFVVHEPVDVRLVRGAAGKTQRQFATAFQIPLGTLRDWEQGRAQPDAPARALLSIIAADPKTVERLLASSAARQPQKDRLPNRVV